MITPTIYTIDAGQAVAMVLRPDQIPSRGLMRLFAPHRMNLAVAEACVCMPARLIEVAPGAFWFDDRGLTTDGEGYYVHNGKRLKQE